MSKPSSMARLLGAVAFALILAAGLWLRGRDLAATPTNGDESESAINALTIEQTGLPRGEYLGLPIFENCLIEPWPQSAEYEFRDSSYSSKGLSIYHGWLPLYAVWLSQQMMHVTPDEAPPVGAPLKVLHTPEEVWRRVIAARLPSVVFGGVFLVFLFVTAREMFGADAGFAAMLVGAIGRPLVYMAREARYHSATLALTTGCCWAVWRVYRYRRWRDFLLTAALLILLFYTHLLGFVIAGAMFGLVVLALWWGGRKQTGNAADLTWKATAVGLIVGCLTAPWVILTGFLDQATHIPPARDFLSFPADLVWYPIVRVPYLILPLLCVVWLVIAYVFHHRLPERVTRPLASHRREIAYLLTWIGLGILAFTLFIPAASYFYKRLTLAVMGPGIVWGAILFAAAARAVSRRRAVLLAPAAFALTIMLGNMSHLWFLEELDDTEAYVAIAHLRTMDLAPGTKVYCTPNDQLTVTYLAGLPVQSVAPVRKGYLDTYPGPIVIIDSAVPYEPLWWGEVRRVASANGQSLTPAEARALTSQLAPRLVEEIVSAKGLSRNQPLPLLSELEQRVVDHQVRRNTRAMEDFARHGGNNPLLRGFAMRDWADWWPLFFYRFVDPESRMGDGLNYSARIRGSSAEVLSSSWVVYQCPPLGSDAR